MNNKKRETHKAKETQRERQTYKMEKTVLERKAKHRSLNLYNTLQY